ncbi:bd4747a7-1240-49b0-bde6-b62f5255f82d [Thermothielavioides terrestris]|uniref:AA9 family lytic polysaccharide monooxygenase E n=3 Tax=Thermothielavioides terrestris TaxID=2587410 RepID=LP9E_THETT|nr:glycoside hydrolase family 61 protein [Thermothielavioides terrestris NRRL 8126]AEO71030.1 glycoside hydrolase family 61 protein [Thermothielavioides terrestris NRRL 8126]SPQ20627.1 bd4747a7-1240-49b0-bde6-b62f5255f82d [Thermothielavioides terrestris]
MLANGAIVFLAAALGVSGHYTWPRVNDGADWQQVRKADNWQDNGYVGDVTSPQIRCFQATPSPAPSVLNTTAGSTVTYWANPDVYHPGPVQFYMARVPDGEDINSWNGDGAVWFKVYEDHPTFGAQLTWPSTGKSSFAVPIPPCIKSGYYLLRAEQIGLHVAQSVGGAQFYISCAQLSVTGGGSTEPPNKVAFPGAYSATDPGILINIYYPVPTSYQNPGPAVFSC